MNGSQALKPTEIDVSEPGKLTTPCPLTDYQRTILSWAAKGKRDYDIAMIMGNTEGGIQQHFYTIRNTLGCSTRISAVVKAIKEGWIE